MDIKEVRTKDPEALKSLLLDLKKEWFNLRFQQASGQLEKTARIKEVRKDIARIKTVFNEAKESKAK